MPEAITTDNAPTAPEAITPDAGATNTAANTSGTATQAATEAQPEKTFTQTDVDRIVTNRLKAAVKAELKKLTADDTDKPSVEELQRQLSEATTRTRSFEARESIRDFLTDARHKMNVMPDNIRAIEELTIGRLEYDEAGKPSNLKDAIEAVKSLAPLLFTNGPSNINANSGRTSSPLANMDDRIRRQAGYGN